MFQTLFGSLLNHLYRDRNQLFDLASFLWTIAFDEAAPTLEQGNFIKLLGSGKSVRYIRHKELMIDIFELNHKNGKITKIV